MKDKEVEDIGKSARTGVAWTGIAQVLKQGLDFGTGIFMARMLAPSDFGVIGATMIFFSFMAIFTSFGFSTAIIQRKELDPDYLGTAQTLAVGTGLFSTACMMSCAHLIGLFFKNPVVGEIVPVMSLMFIITSFNIVPNALISRKMEFQKVTTISVLGSCVYSGVALSMAFLGYGVWSLVFGPLLGALVGVLLLSKAACYRPRFRFNMNHLKELISFGGFMTVSSLLNHLGRNADNLIVGRYLGPEPLGFYTRAYNLGTLPKEVVVSVLGSVLFPAFARIQNEGTRLKDAYLKSINAVMVVAVPFCLLLAVTAADFVPVVYGNKWFSSVAPLRGLALGGLFYCLFVPCTSVLLALGKTRTYTRLQIFYSVAVAGSVFLLREQGIYIISLMVTAVIIVCCFAYLTSVNRALHIRGAEYWGRTKVSLLANLALLAVLIATKLLLDRGTSAGSFGKLALESAAGALAYVSALIAGKDAVAIEVRDAVSQKMLRVVRATES